MVWKIYQKMGYDYCVLGYEVRVFWWIGTNILD
jgi:hypothetical protein